MMYQGLSAEADLVGRRIWLSWAYALEPLEVPGDLPDVLLRRKERDFDFPPLVPGDPYLVHDSAAFPPAPVPGVLQVTDMPDRIGMEDGLRIQVETVSVAQVNGGVPTEILRHERTVYFDEFGTPVRVCDRLLDAIALAPLVPVYYEIDDGSAPDAETIGDYRAVCAPGNTYGLNRRLWDMVPEVYRAPDTALLPAGTHVPGVPETARRGGQLQRFIDVFGMGADRLRASAEGLQKLRDAMTIEPRFLGPLGRMVGWQRSEVVPLPRQRNELATANRLFDVVGTAQAMRALVTSQVGWRSQIAEFAQNVTRANTPPRRSLYLRAERPGGGVGPAWQGGFDAADVFAFPPAGAVGAGTLPAVLDSVAVEPFALAAGQELTLEIDGNPPVRVRFGPQDFADIAAATAAEVATVLNMAFDSLRASDQGGLVRIETVATGPTAEIRLARTRQSLLALNDAPDGQISATTAPDGVRRIFYADRLDPGWQEAAPHVAEIAPVSAMPGTEPVRRILMQKSWAFGEWRDAVALPDWSEGGTDPAAALLADGRTWLGFDQGARLRFALGATQAAQPAVISGRRAGPFALTAGTQVRAVGELGTETFTVNPGDYALIAAATPAEVAAAMNAQFANVVASALADGTLRLTSVALGETARLRVDLAGSTAARVLGFAGRELSGRGRWEAPIDWVGALAGPALWNRAESPTVMDEPLGGGRAAWAEHNGRGWAIRTAHWSERVTLATAAGVAQSTAGGPWTVWTTVDGLLNDDVRAVAADFSGRLWFATASGLSARRPDNVWTGFTTLDGLASTDLRALAILPDGTVACATPAGLSEVDLAGAVTNTATAIGGLIGNDIRALTADGNGALWLATTAGISRRGLGGVWQSWTVADGLPPGAPRGIAVATDSRVAVATGAGVAVFDGAAWSVVDVAAGLPSNDVRGVAWWEDGTLYAATAAGLGIFSGRRWRHISTSEGLPVNDLGAVVVDADGRLILGSGAGLVIGTPNGGWTLQGLADGLPAALVPALHAGWSTPFVLDSGGGANRTPHLALEAGGEIWTLYSHRAAARAGLADDWTLRLRRWDPAAWTFAAPQAITVPPPAGGRDARPYAEPAGGGFRVFFETDRAGGRNLATVAVNAAGVAGPVAPFGPEPDELGAPCVLPGPGGTAWLVHRADSGVVAAQATRMPPPRAPGSRASVRVPSAIAISHRAGCRAPVFGHAARNLEQRRWGDAFTYTPEHPDRIDDELETQTHLYTRRSIGLYLRQSPIGQPITQDAIARLRQLLQRFLPINLRLVLIVAPEPTVEFIYTPGADIGEAWMDNAPIIDTLTGLSDSTAAAMPGVGVLISNNVADLSADPLNLATLMRRTWFPDLI